MPRKINLKNYVKRLAKQKLSESFSFEFYNFMYEGINSDNEKEKFKTETRVINQSDKIELIP